MATHTSTPEARNRAKAKYVKTHYDTFLLKFPKKNNLKSIVAEHAKKNKESMSAFINRAIKETMENDNKKAQ